MIVSALVALASFASSGFIGAGPGTVKSVNSLHLPKSRMKFDFIALGDNRPAGAYLPPTKVFKGLLQDVATIDPTFVISSGDLIFGKDEPVSQFMVESKQVKALIAKLPCPFFNAPGNHEISDRPDFYKAYLKEFGPTYGSFKFGAFRFLQVCTEELGSAPGISPAEMAWLKKVLANPGPKIAFQHHPVIARKSNPSPETIKNPEVLEEVYKDGGVRAVFQGHDHAYDHQNVDGVDYFLSGGAGAPLEDFPQNGGFFHFLLVHVDGDKITADVIAAGSIEVTDTPAGVTIGNYAAADLPLGNVTTFRKHKPTSASGKVFRGKKVTNVKVKIVSTKPVKGGYLVRLSLKAPMHRATVVSLAN